MAELIGGGGGYDDVQDTEPSNPSIGDTWLDTSTDSGTGKIYANLGGGADWHTLPVQNELENGVTRNKLSTLEGGVSANIVDPLNKQENLSVAVTQDGSDYELEYGGELIDGFNDPDPQVTDSPDWNNWFSDTGLSIESGPNSYRGMVNGDYLEFLSDAEEVSNFISRSSAEKVDSIYLRWVIGSNTVGTANYTQLSFESGGNDVIARIQFEDYENELIVNEGGSNEIIYNNFWTEETLYEIEVVFDWNNYQYDLYINGSIVEENVDMINNGTNLGRIQITNRTIYNNEYRKLFIDDIAEGGKYYSDNYVTDEYSITPTDTLKRWREIQAKGVNTGGSTSTNPVEFGILNQSNTEINSSRIPKSEIADSGFKISNRKYQTTASANQTQITIPSTGGGGHYGIPIESVVQVKRNGLTLEDGWSFDGNDTITLDTSASDGDNVTIIYTFDIQDETLKPRAYFNVESASESPPSISHFKYTYTKTSEQGSGVGWYDKTPQSEVVSNGTLTVNGSGYVIGLTNYEDDDTYFRLYLDGTRHDVAMGSGSMGASHSLLHRFNNTLKIDETNGGRGYVWYVLD